MTTFEDFFFPTSEEKQELKRAVAENRAASPEVLTSVLHRLVEAVEASDLQQRVDRER